MIKIRTVTYNMPQVFGEDDLSKIRKATSRWEGFKYSLHTQRMNFPIYKEIQWDMVDQIADFCSHAGIRWFGIPVDVSATGNTETLIEDILSSYPNAFVNMICAHEGKIRDNSVRQIARQFLRNSATDPEGLIGFGFGASNNVLPNGPFFPFTYADGKHLGFSIGLELAEEINQLCEKNYADINAFRNAVVQQLEPQFDEIEEKALEVSELTGLEFDGIDFSLAPLPEEGNSVMTILKKIGIKNINNTGMLFATAFFTKMLKGFAAKHKAVGFAGVMYSLLEDADYAQMNDKNEFSLNNMIALSTMCGCGVDMVPIPMSTTEEQIRTILLEVACVSSRLQKPLGVRLLPVKDYGDGHTHFTGEKDFVINTRIVDVNVNEIEFINGLYEY